MAGPIKCVAELDGQSLDVRFLEHGEMPTRHGHDVDPAERVRAQPMPWRTSGALNTSSPALKTVIRPG